MHPIMNCSLSFKGKNVMIRLLEIISFSDYQSYRLSRPPPKRSTEALGAGAGGAVTVGGAFRSMLSKSPIRLSPAGMTEGCSAKAVGLLVTASSVDPKLKSSSTNWQLFKRNIIAH